MLKELSLEHYTEAVASTAAVPGGGSVSALAGSLAAALAAMVARLTLNKKKFAHVAKQMKTLEQQAQQLQDRLMAAVDRDADSYRKVLSAFRMPKGTEKEIHARSQAIQSAFKHAAEVPLEVAGLCSKIMDLVNRAVRHGRPDLLTDAGVAMLLARSAALGALMNVRINLTGMRDDNVAASMGADVDRLKNEVLQKEKMAMKDLPL